MTTDTVPTAAQLVAASELIDASPGLNVLDALRQSLDGAHADDALRVETYEALRAYIDPPGGQLAPWADRQTGEHVAARMRSCARRLNGDNGHVGAAPGYPASAVPKTVADRTEKGQPGWKRAERRTGTESGL